MAFQHLLIFKLFSFSYKIFTLDNSPKILKSCLKLNCTRELNYNLRNKEKFSLTRSHTTFGDLTFSSFFPKLINSYKTELYVDTSINLKFFNLHIYNNINIIYKKVEKNFTKLNLSCNYYNYKKKKVN